ncbi:hypothetical protein NSK_000379 [Nannochloropsis salina CCMP1776]|uniref:Ribosomal protein L13 n=1 Tax=Nannochloropsis salina CCMP1776 TaxID=1027361 RepID=A0A4D9DEH5_9STRA|nr:hypothetical protein NSK_000379 [Nannochloropsis salina CCMP1776]|eukprot:TFJ88025.1 hypothetical protein NSK_000379 [Nannochloropsis salina CCMP1776]
MSTSKAATTAASAIFTRVSSTVKDAALEAVKKARPQWHLVDAKDQVVGRLASQIASIIRGRHKPFYCPNADCGDYVVVVNARHVTLTGRKMKDKKYYWHTMHPGGLKSRTPEQLIERGQAEEILRHAVLGMLPKNKLRNHAIKKLRVFPEKYHIYEEQLRGKQSLL